MAFRVVAQRDRYAIGAGARGAADAMDVGFRHFRQFEVDDVGHAVDVDAARGNVGRHQHARLAGLEIAERALAMALALVAVDGAGRHAGFIENFRDAIGAALGAREDERALYCAVGQQANQKVALALGVDEIGALRDAFGGGRDRRHFHAGGIVQHFACELGDLLRHGRREKQRLARLGQFRDNATDRHDEAEVEHVIGLVEHDDFRRIETQAAAFHMVEQATGRCDQYIQAA